MIQRFKAMSRQTKVALIAAALIVLGGGAAFAWWTISPLFIDVRVNEALTEEENVDTASFQTLLSGAFSGADSLHQVSGMAHLIDRGADRIVRFEDDFASTNGPDLFVWLVRDLEAITGDYVDLGVLKGNLGAQNYAVPEGVDVADYPIVIIWCKAFGVLFGSATLAGV